MEKWDLPQSFVHASYDEPLQTSSAVDLLAQELDGVQGVLVHIPPEIDDGGVVKEIAVDAL